MLSYRLQFILVLFLSLISGALQAQTKILFDATKAETAGNADWVIDANAHNIGWNPDAQINNGDDANAQRLPLPAQSGITSTTPESFWEGGISSWGINCVNQGYIVETLPYNGSITFNNPGNLQDLSNYNIFIVCEPNILFSNTEKAAILSFVSAGGSLFMISDHDQSDRNFDGFDSPTIWNDLMSSNPFGITFNLNNYSQSSTSISTNANDSIVNGPFGHVTEVLWSGGTDMTIDAGVNPSVNGAVFKNGYLNNNSKVMFAYCRYGSGKVAAIGDSSPADDGSGDPNDFLYDGYIADASGNHQKLLMNATIWLATSDSSTNSIINLPDDNFFNVYSIGKNIVVKNSSGKNAELELFDITGHRVLHESSSPGLNQEFYSFPFLCDGIYIAKLSSDKFNSTYKLNIVE